MEKIGNKFLDISDSIEDINDFTNSPIVQFHEKLGNTFEPSTITKMIPNHEIYTHIIASIRSNRNKGILDIFTRIYKDHEVVLNNISKLRDHWSDGIISTN